MNDLVDRLADIIIQTPIQSQAFIESNFKFERLQVTSDGREVPGNLHREIDNVTGEHSAKMYLAKPGKINGKTSHRFGWTGWNTSRKSIPKCTDCGSPSISLVVVTPTNTCPTGSLDGQHYVFPV